MSILSGPARSEIGSSPLASMIKSSRRLFMPCCPPGHLAEVSLTDVSGPTTIPFGNWPFGTYIVKNCKGAWHFGNLGWAVCRAPALANVPPSGGGWFIGVLFNGPDGETEAHNNEPMPSAGWDGYATENAAAAAACGKYALFTHYGGTIQIYFVDNPYSDNSVGSVAPTFRLYLLSDKEPCFELVSAVTANTSGNNWSGTFVLKEVCEGYGGRCTFSLEESGGIVNPSAPSVHDVSPNGEYTVGFTWEAETAGECDFTATISIYSELFDKYFDDVVVDIADILDVEFSSIVPQNYYNCDTSVYFLYIKLWNRGNAPTSSSCVVSTTAASGAIILDMDYTCNTAAIPMVKACPGIVPGQFTMLVFAIRKASQADTSFVLDFAFTEDYHSHPPGQLTIAYP